MQRPGHARSGQGRAGAGRGPYAGAAASECPEGGEGAVGEGEVKPQQRAHLMRLSAWTSLALGFFLGAALLAWWFE
jgi:hypothetical protein